jgi:hypothetical protein
MPAPHEPFPEHDDYLPCDPPFDLPFDDYGGLNLQIGTGEPLFARPLLKARVVVTHAFFVVALVSFITLLLLLLRLVFSDGRSEFEVAVYTELASGLAMFAILPVVLHLSELWPERTYAALLLLSLASGVAAWWLTGTARSLLLEAGGGLLTILVLDIGYIALVRQLSESALQAAHQYAEFREQWDE